MAIDLHRIRSVLEAAEAALVDLGACDDETCDLLQCAHALPQVRALLADLEIVSRATRDSAALVLEPMRHHTLACPTCGGDLSVRQVRVIDGDVEWEMDCGRGHIWTLVWDMWRRAGLRVWVHGRRDEPSR